ncbi:MAG TPA: NADP-dependent oxidoreductase [Pyrinomonadaceae bacterium]|nr:NADP-dependent oxidoreductase [Pyrinomonadaceae bacterium]
MKAARIHEFGPPCVIVIDDIPRPIPVLGEVLVRVVATGVGPWDGWIRSHTSVVKTPLPLTLGSDLAGFIEEIGPGVSGFRQGEEIYGVTNTDFTGANAEYAIASAAMIGPKPGSLDFLQAASVPVVAVTAWQMLFEYGKATAGQTVLIHGGAGNVGAYAVQLAHVAKLKIFATCSAEDAPYVRSLGATNVIDYTTTKFEDVVRGVDIVIDTVGGDIQERSLQIVSQAASSSRAFHHFPAHPNAQTLAQRSFSWT